LVDARGRTGGRILSHNVKQQAFDLGPAWFWPGQPRLASLVKHLGLTFFEQYSEGDILSEEQSGTVHRGGGYASMQGSYRIAGGIAQLTAGLASNLPEGRVFLETALMKLSRTGAGIQARLDTAGRSWSVSARRVVLALPPRIAASTIEFSPPLPDVARQAMEAIPTWMAGQAKIVTVYDRPVWRENGLSGDAMSRRGPMVEIHDASPHRGGPYALFGFVGVPAEVRLPNRDRLLTLAIEQLEGLFGAGMGAPLSVVLQDWAQDPQTATAADARMAGHHPAYGLPPALKAAWGDQLLFGSTEIAPHFGGFLEGALEASEQVFAGIAAAVGAAGRVAAGGRGGREGRDLRS